MGAPGAVAEWLNAEWLDVRERPVELRRGVLAGGVFRYREYNTGQSGEEQADSHADSVTRSHLARSVHARARERS